MDLFWRLLNSNLSWPLYAFLDLIRFNVIGKLETIVEDTTYISQKANLNLDISQFPWANKKGATKDSSLDYFKQIDAKSILKLYEIYKIDFEMFGYSVSEYLWSWIK